MDGQLVVLVEINVISCDINGNHYTYDNIKTRIERRSENSISFWYATTKTLSNDCYITFSILVRFSTPWSSLYEH